MLLSNLPQYVSALLFFFCLPKTVQTSPTEDVKISSRTIKISPCDPSFAEGLLKLHNLIRENHSAPPLRLNSNMSFLAQSWSEEVAQNGYLKHRPNRKMGENLYSATLLYPKRLYPNQPMALWYGERVRYRWYGGEPDLNYFNDWGHFTALVWRSTRLAGIGCAMELAEVVRKEKNGKYITTTAKSVFVTVNFYPKGNVVGRFGENVLPSRGEEEGESYNYDQAGQASYQSPVLDYYYPKSTTKTYKTTKYYSTATPTKTTTPYTTTSKPKPTYSEKPYTTTTKVKKLTTKYSTTPKSTTPYTTTSKPKPTYSKKPYTTTTEDTKLTTKYSTTPKTKKLTTRYSTTPKITTTPPSTTTTNKPTTTTIYTPEPTYKPETTTLEYETETYTTPPASTDEYTHKPTPPQHPPCNPDFSHYGGYFHYVPHLQPPPPPPPIAYPIDFTDPDDFDDFLKKDSLESKSSKDSSSRKR